MKGLSYLFSGLSRPLVVVAILLVGAGVLSVDPSAGRASASGFACKGFTNNAELNRAMCRFHPARIWNTPVADLVPGLRQN